MISFEVLIAVTTLVWLIHTFVFNLIQTFKADLLRRIQFALSITKEGTVDTGQLFAKGWLSEFDIYELGTFTTDKDTHEKISRYAKTQIRLKRIHTALVVNLFIFTVLAAYLIFSQNGFSFTFIFKLYFFFTLGLVFLSYFQIEDMRNVKFTLIDTPPEPEPESQNEEEIAKS